NGISPRIMGDPQADCVPTSHGARGTHHMDHNPLIYKALVSQPQVRATMCASLGSTQRGYATRRNTARFAITFLRPAPAAYRPQMHAWSSALRSVTLSAVSAKNQSEPAEPVSVSLRAPAAPPARRSTPTTARGESGRADRRSPAADGTPPNRSSSSEPHVNV